MYLSKSYTSAVLQENFTARTKKKMCITYFVQHMNDYKAANRPQQISGSIAIYVKQGSIITSITKRRERNDVLIKKANNKDNCATFRKRRSENLFSNDKIDHGSCSTSKRWWSEININQDQLLIENDI